LLALTGRRGRPTAGGSTVSKKGRGDGKEKVSGGASYLKRKRSSLGAHETKVVLISLKKKKLRIKEEEKTREKKDTSRKLHDGRNQGKVLETRGAQNRNFLRKKKINSRPACEKKRVGREKTDRKGSQLRWNHHNGKNWCKKSDGRSGKKR